MSKTYSLGYKKNSAMALVIVLLTVVLVTILFLALFSWSTLNRQASFGNLRQAQVDLLTETAVQTIVGDLKGEILEGSDVGGTGTNHFFRPKHAGNLMPTKSPTNAIPNLVKVSKSGLPAWTNSVSASFVNVGPARASASSSTSRSKNRRYISQERWKAPALVADSLFSSHWRDPDWILITRDGAATNGLISSSLTELGNPASGNNSFVLGRFSYAIYNVGGLLDINATGNRLSAQQNRLKGRSHSADLQQIDAILDPQTLIQWRWPITSTNASAVYPGLSAPSRQFDRVEAADASGSEQIFANRQELLKYQALHTNQFQVDALPYLTVFSREVNAPSAKPSSADPVRNPGFFEICWTTDRVLPDGTKVKTGEPVVASRFPLSRLALVSDSAVSGTNDASNEIYRYFGLSRTSNSDPWIYDHGNPNNILTLAQVEALGREPDFFELLKASLLQGSLGKAGFAAGDNWDMAKSQSRDVNKDIQILQIGANLIDQADPDSWPTPIRFGTTDIFGVEDLPYFYAIFNFYYRPLTGNNATRDTMGNWFVPVLWNPHQAPLTPSGVSSFRIVATGKTEPRLGASIDEDMVSWQNPLTQKIRYGTPYDLATTGSLTFSTAGIVTVPYSYREPKLLNTLDGASSTAANLFENPNGGKLVGFFGGSLSAPDKRITNNSSHTKWSAAAPVFSNRTFNPVSFTLQYERANGSWRTYQSIGGLGPNILWYAPYPQDDAYRSPYVIFAFQKVDPRTNRFGVAEAAANVSNGGSIRVLRNSQGRRFEKGAPQAPYFVNSEGAPAARLATVAENNPGGAITPSSYYADPDGIVRPGDGRYGSYPQAQGGDLDSESRPVILNRPFQSVGEMSFAFRDLPWKTLDFFSDKSADARCLDVFSVDDNRVVAGKVDLNTQNPDVIRSLLSGTGLNLVDGGTTSLSAQDADTLAKFIVNNGPYAGLDDLIQKLAPASSYPLSGDRARLKQQREVAVRALASATQTRTWNLMIDVICQVGKYPAAPTGVDDFIVEGEQRVWIHLAIDRFTGKIVSQSSERVFD